MIRHAAAVAVVLCLSPSWLFAQSIQLTVKTASANVYKAPSTGSPVIGKAPRGSALEVTRELGDWVRVSWPDAQDGVGYVHRSVGSVALSSTAAPSRATGFTASPPAPQTAPTTTASGAAEDVGAVDQRTSQRAEYIAPPTHFVGLGGRMGGPTLGWGASVRGWSRSRVGVQIEVSRYAFTSATVPGRLTSTQFAPSLLYSLPDRVTDYVWVRPYLGGGANVYRSTLSGVTPVAGDSLSNSRFSLQAFGGGEMTFASVPRFAVSAEIGYQPPRTPFEGFELGGLGFSVSGHWYIK